MNCPNVTIAEVSVLENGRCSSLSFVYLSVLVSLVIIALPDNPIEAEFVEWLS